MYTKKYNFNRIIKCCMVLPMLFLAACTAEDFNTPSQPQDEGVVLNVNIAGSSSVDLSRVSSERTDRNRIDDMNIVLADAAGKITKIIYLSNGAEVNSSPEKENDALISGSFPNNGGDGFKYHLGTESMKGVSQIYIVCNYWKVDKSGNILEEYKNLNKFLEENKITTIEDLTKLQQGTPFIAGIQTSTLFGQASPDIETNESHQGQVYKCELKRTTAMITVAISSKDLKNGVKITPRSIQLHNVPTQCYIGKENAVNSLKDDNEIQDNVIPGTPDGLMQQVGWDPLTSEKNITVGGHGNDVNIVPLFMFENKQGEYGSNGDEIKKDPDPKKKDFCSYLEVTADYLYTPKIAGVDQKYISGPIKYRLYLGENITNDFNVNRNKHYQVTLSLTGMGGLVEDGKTDKEGNFIGEGADASWRVESSGVSGGGSFLTDGLNMSSNGFLSYVGFVKEEGHKYGLYAPGNKGWLWAANKNGTPISWIPYEPTEDTDIQEFKGEQCGGEKGAFYFMIYAEPWLDEVSPWRNAGGNTISEWIANGFREQVLHLYDFTARKEVSKLTVRQWLPMPVMVDDNGEPISGDPNKASFYYSRIDVYEGREIPWAPSYFDNITTINTQNFLYYTSAQFSTTRNYNPNYGFDNIVALYGTRPDAFTFNSDYGRPGTAVGVAIFRAGNDVTQDKVKYSFDQLGRIGLPTVAEWEKIMKYGVVDVRFGISNVPYWTSTMENTQTYVYNPISGVKNLEKRTVSHRVRLVYHKNDFAQKKW